MESKTKTVALVFAGGSGVRMGAKEPKQFLDLDGRPVLARTLDLFENHPLVDAIYLVVNADYLSEITQATEYLGISKLAGACAGGETAQDSIYNGLKYLEEHEEPDTIVLIHDGVRPYVTEETITANIEGVRKFGNAITYTPCFETIVLSSDGVNIDNIPARRVSYTAQAPQSFRLAEILNAHERIRSRPERYTDMVDQATICFTLGIKVHLVPGNRGNVKITTPEDLVTLKALIDWRNSK